LRLSVAGFDKYQRLNVPFSMNFNLSLVFLLLVFISSCQRSLQSQLHPLRESTPIDRCLIRSRTASLHPGILIL